MTKALPALGYAVGRHRARSLMREAGVWVPYGESGASLDPHMLGGLGQRDVRPVLDRRHMISVACASIRCERRSPPCGRAAVVPVRHQRASQQIAVLSPIS